MFIPARKKSWQKWEKTNRYLAHTFRRHSLFISVVCRRPAICVLYFFDVSSLNGLCKYWKPQCIAEVTELSSVSFGSNVCLCYSLPLEILHHFSVDCLRCTMLPHTWFRCAINMIRIKSSCVFVRGYTASVACREQKILTRWLWYR